jgi:hypothetical protein
MCNGGGCWCHLQCTLYSGSSWLQPPWCTLHTGSRWLQLCAINKQRQHVPVCHHHGWRLGVLPQHHKSRTADCRMEAYTCF